MKTPAKIVCLLLLLWLVYRPIVHALCLPGAVHSSWVEPLATTGDRHSGRAEMLPDEDTNVLNLVFKANDQKRKLYTMYTTGKGEYGLSRQYSTVEADPIETWLLVQDGKVTFIKDSSHDGGAPPYAIHTRTPLKIKLGYLHDRKFIEGEPASTDSPVIVFKLIDPKTDESLQIYGDYFY